MTTAQSVLAKWMHIDLYEKHKDAVKQVLEERERQRDQLQKELHERIFMQAGLVTSIQANGVDLDQKI